MATIEVDLDEFDFDELVMELIDRFKYEKNLSESRKRLSITLAKVIGKSLSIPVLPDSPSLADTMKLEFAQDLMGKYTESQLREMEFLFKDKNHIY